MQRNKNIDVMRGLGIIMMVAGHCGSPITGFVYIFHMALFFMISGFCFNSKNSNDYKSVLRYILKKLKSIWFVFFFWSTIFILLTNVFIKINIYTNDIEAIGIANVTYCDYYTFGDMLYRIGQALLFRTRTNLCGSFWFLVVLFCICILYCINDYLIKLAFKNSKKINIIAQAFLSILFLSIGYIFSKYDIIIRFQLAKTFSFYCLFFIGYLLKTTNLFSRIKSNIIHIILLFCSTTILILFLVIGPGPVELNNNIYNSPLYLVISSIVGFTFTYELSYFICKCKMISDIFKVIGQNTLAIIVFHLLVFRFISYLEVLYYGLPKYMISSYPILYADPYWWILYLISGVTIPILLSLAYKYIKSKLVKKFIKSQKMQL